MAEKKIQPKKLKNAYPGRPVDCTRLPGHGNCKGHQTQPEALRLCQQDDKKCPYASNVFLGIAISKKRNYNLSK